MIYKITDPTGGTELTSTIDVLAIDMAWVATDEIVYIKSGTATLDTRVMITISFTGDIFTETLMDRDNPAAEDIAVFTSVGPYTYALFMMTDLKLY